MGNIDRTKCTAVAILERDVIVTWEIVRGRSIKRRIYAHRSTRQRGWRTRLVTIKARTEISHN